MFKDKTLLISCRKFRIDCVLLFIVFLTAISFGRLLLLRDVFWDDNCWLMSAYTSNNLREFLGTGFTELRREPIGTFFYYFFRLHKTFEGVFVIWQTVSIGIQVLSAVLLYVFFKDVFKNTQLAFLIAVCFIICPIDSTTPVFVSLPYRLGLMLTILSFLLTYKALVAKGGKWLFFVTAMICTGFAQYVFIEGVVAVEPARLFMIGYVIFQKKVTRQVLLRKTMKFWLPFGLVCVPLVIYKLMNRPYGIYEGAYTSNRMFLFDIDKHIQVLRHLFFYPVFYLKRISHVSPWSVGFGFCTFAGVLLILKRMMAKPEPDMGNRRGLTGDDSAEESKRTLPSVKLQYLSAVLLLIPPILLYEFAGRVPRNGPTSRHAIVLKPGYAILLGTTIYVLFIIVRTSRLKGRILLVVTSLIVGGGAFINNLNLDLYFRGWRMQQAFWRAFTSRFPALPADAAFLIDVEGWSGSGLENSDLDNYYDFEFVLNMLYVQSIKPTYFRKYKVIAAEDWIKHEGFSDDSFVRKSHWGRDVISLSEVIVVYYSEGQLFVNKEIVARYPDAPYRVLLTQDFPQLPEARRYPLRVKMKEFCQRP